MEGACTPPRETRTAYWAAPDSSRTKIYGDNTDPDTHSQEEE